MPSSTEARAADRASSTRCLLLLQLGLGSGADLDNRNAAGQLGQALLQLLAVVVAGGGLDQGLDLVDAGLDGLLVATALDDGGVVLVGAHAAGLAEVGQCHAVKLAADFLGDDLAAGEDGDVAQHFLAAVAEAGGLDAKHIDGAAQLVDDQGRQRLALDILGDDDEVLAAGLEHLLQNGQNVGDGRDLLVGDQDVGVVDLGDHLLGVGDEVGGDVAAVELHTLDVLGLEAEVRGSPRR